ncbi:hypothetical protein BDR26DRAFT_865818 [Obelidium mucronatum]|nr:hypothetical protein BDR26DRAFT_865818 [Obelidium mucronatum]
MNLFCCLPTATPAKTDAVDSSVTAVSQGNSDPIVTQQPANPPSLFWSVAPVAPPAPKGPYILHSRGFSAINEQVQLACAIKNVPIQVIEWSTTDALPEWFNIASPNGKFPVLQFPDGSYSTSTLEFLERLEKESATPSFFMNAKECQEWIALIRNDFIPHFESVLLDSDAFVQADQRPKLNSTIRKITNQLERSYDSSFLLGNSFTAADLLLAPFLHRLPLLTYFRGIDFSNTKLVAYVSTLHAQPHVTETLTPLSKLETHYIKTLPRESPLSIIRLQHIAIKYHMDKCVGIATQMSHGFVADMRESSQDLHSRFQNLLFLLRVHAAMEQQVLFPVFESSASKLIAKVLREHEREEEQLQGLEAEVESVLKRIITLGDSKKYPRSDDFKAFVNSLRSLAVGQRVHMNGEEADFAPLFAKLTTGEEKDLFKKVYAHLAPRNSKKIPLLVEGLSVQERAQYLYNVQITVSNEEAHEFTTMWRSSLNQDEWNDLKRRLEM